MDRKVAAQRVGRAVAVVEADTEHVLGFGNRRIPGGDVHRG